MSNDSIKRLTNNFYALEPKKYNFENIKASEIYFRTLMFQSLNASKRFKNNKLMFDESKENKINQIEMRKLEFVKENKTNDDLLNTLSYEDKVELLAKVKERLGFIYYPGCRDIYEIKNYDEALNRCNEEFNKAKEEFLIQKDIENNNIKRTKKKYIF